MHEIGSAQVLTMAADTTTWWENEINHKILGSHPISVALSKNQDWTSQAPSDLVYQAVVPACQQALLSLWSWV